MTDGSKRAVPAPPEVLCHPDPGKSCAACCGLYNRTDNSRAAVVRLLRKTTATFRSIGGIEGDLESYSRTMRPLVNRGKLCETVFNCEFLGFLDDEEKLVGCMLHPEANGGFDLRDASFYGRDLCRGHLCISHTKLAPEERLAVAAGISDWYLYGLAATDIDLVKGFFHMAAAKLGEMPKASLMDLPRVRGALGSFFALKENWPFRDHEAPRLGKYLFFGDGYTEAAIDYDSLSLPRSRFHSILVSLESSFQKKDELLEAERIIEECIDRFAAGCRGSERQERNSDIPVRKANG